MILLWLYIWQWRWKGVLCRRWSPKGNTRSYHWGPAIRRRSLSTAVLFTCVIVDISFTALLISLAHRTDGGSRSLCRDAFQKAVSVVSFFYFLSLYIILVHKFSFKPYCNLWGYIWSYCKNIWKPWEKSNTWMQCYLRRV